MKLFNGDRLIREADIRGLARELLIRCNSGHTVEEVFNIAEAFYILAEERFDATKGENDDV